jgi:outer membrane receptor protein involved in Fe transport
MRAGMRFQGRSPTAAWNIETSARVVNGQDRVATSLLETPTGGFTVWDTRAVFQPQRWENLTIATGIENMFDKKYREHLDFRTNNGLSIFQPGANFYVSTTVTY